MHEHASNSAEETSAQATGRLGFSGRGGFDARRLQRAVYGVDLATDAGPVQVLQDSAGPTGTGLCDIYPMLPRSLVCIAHIPTTTTTTTALLFTPQKI